MDERDSAGKQLLLLLLGILMCGSGLFLLFNKVPVTNSFNGMYRNWGIFGERGISFGMVIIPFILGIVVWVIFPRSFAGKLITMLGTLFIVLGIISSISLGNIHMSLFEFILIMILIFGGGALALRILFMPDGGQTKNKKGKIDQINDRFN